MKLKKLGAISMIALLVVACGFKKSTPPVPTKTNGMFDPVAVIELFTSQGCSSCPPADALLTQTISDAKAGGKKILALSYHVDYWNRLGWTDPFSSSLFSQRQSNYVAALHLEGAYTPQMVVNGNSEFVGSDKNLLAQSLSKVFNSRSKINFTTLTATVETGKPVKVSFALEGDYTASSINIALMSLNETTVVKRGENGGHTLTSENVVRQLVTRQTTASGEIEFSNAPAIAKDNMAVVAFVQEEKGLTIIGGAMATIN